MDVDEGGTETTSEGAVETEAVEGARGLAALDSEVCKGLLTLRFALGFLSFKLLHCPDPIIWAPLKARSKSKWRLILLPSVG